MLTWDSKSFVIRQSGITVFRVKFKAISKGKLRGKFKARFRAVSRAR